MAADPPKGQPLVTRLVKPWPYELGGVVLGVITVAYLYAQGHWWGLTTTWTYWGGWLGRLAGLQVDTWPYFQRFYGPDSAKYLMAPWLYPGTWLNLAIILGALLAALLTGGWRPRRPRLRALLVALVGGLLMGYGARLAMGCNIGALLGGVASFSPHGWLFALGTTAGAATGWWLLRYLLPRG